MFNWLATVDKNETAVQFDESCHAIILTLCFLLRFVGLQRNDQHRSSAEDHTTTPRRSRYAPHESVGDREGHGRLLRPNEGRRSHSAVPARTKGQSFYCERRLQCAVILCSSRSSLLSSLPWKSDLRTVLQRLWICVYSSAPYT